MQQTYFWTDITSILGKIDTINTTINSKVDLFSCEIKSDENYAFLWFD